ncbi:MAG: dienelactone hydrolase family protein [Vicinamibacterales bacterium]
MHRLLSALGVSGLVLVLAIPSFGQAPRIRNTRFVVPEVGMVSFGLVVPQSASGGPQSASGEPQSASGETQSVSAGREAAPGAPESGAGGALPLVVVLHAGGERVAYQGSRIVQELVLPALGGLGAVIVAPDCPAASWTDPSAERAVLALVDHIRQTQSIDPTRILVTGFSMGGRGAWFLSRRHPALFTDAIVMAAPAAGAEEAAGKVPTYVIHSRDDRVVPFGPVAQEVGRLASAGYPIHFEVVDGAGHVIGRFVEPLRTASAWLAARWRR